VPWYVITTKQERFVKQILKANAIELADERFWIGSQHEQNGNFKRAFKNPSNETVYFVEDRLPTLLNILKNDELASV